MANPCVYAVAIAEFDQIKGNTLTHLEPKDVSLPHSAETLAEGCLPDGAHNVDSDSTYIICKRDEAAPELFGTSIFVNKRDPAARRGATQKALLLLTTVPIFDTFAPAMRTALDHFMVSGDEAVLASLRTGLNTALGLGHSVYIFNQSFALPYPLPVLGPDQYGGVSLVKLLDSFEKDAMRIWQATLLGRRVVFRGESGEQTSNCVLATALMTAPVTGFAARTWPYVSLQTFTTDVLASPYGAAGNPLGYLCGVTNSLFDDKSQWWDVLAVAGSKAGSGSGSSVRVRDSKDKDLKPLPNEASFIKKVLAGMRARMSPPSPKNTAEAEAWVRSEFMARTVEVVEAVRGVMSGSGTPTSTMRKTAKRFHGSRVIKDHIANADRALSPTSTSDGPSPTSPSQGVAPGVVGASAAAVAMSPEQASNYAPFVTRAPPPPDVGDNSMDRTIEHFGIPDDDLNVSGHAETGNRWNPQGVPQQAPPPTQSTEVTSVRFSITYVGRTTNMEVPLGATFAALRSRVKSHFGIVAAGSFALRCKITPLLPGPLERVVDDHETYLMLGRAIRRTAVALGPPSVTATVEHKRAPVQRGPSEHAASEAPSVAAATRGSPGGAAASSAMPVVRKNPQWGVPGTTTTELHSAARMGDLERVKRLAARDGAIFLEARDRHAQTALHHAAWEGHSHVLVHLLQQCGADVDSRDASGVSPLHCAASRGHTSAIQVLFQAGARLNLRDDNGWMPLHRTATLPDHACTELLLSLNADAAAVTPMGWTPLHVAARYSTPAVVAALLRHKSPLLAPDRTGKEPVHVARERGGAEGDAIVAAMRRTANALGLHLIESEEEAEEQRAHEAGAGADISPEAREQAAWATATFRRAGEAVASRGFTLEKAFERFDVDCDGELSASELHDAMLSLGIRVTYYEAESLLRHGKAQANAGTTVTSNDATAGLHYAAWTLALTGRRRGVGDSDVIYVTVHEVNPSHEGRADRTGGGLVVAADLLDLSSTDVTGGPTTLSTDRRRLQRGSAVHTWVASDNTPILIQHRQRIGVHPDHDGVANVALTQELAGDPHRPIPITIYVYEESFTLGAPPVLMGTAVHDLRQQIRSGGDDAEIVAQLHAPMSANYRGAALSGMVTTPIVGTVKFGIEAIAALEKIRKSLVNHAPTPAPARPQQPVPHGQGLPSTPGNPYAAFVPNEHLPYSNSTNDVHVQSAPAHSTPHATHAQAPAPGQYGEHGGSSHSIGANNQWNWSSGGQQQQQQQQQQQYGAAHAQQAHSSLVPRSDHHRASYNRSSGDYRSGGGYRSGAGGAGGYSTHGARGPTTLSSTVSYGGHTHAHSSGVSSGASEFSGLGRNVYPSR